MRTYLLLRFPISEIRPANRPSRLGADTPLNQREPARIFRGHEYWANGIGRDISEHIAKGSIWSISPSIVRRWVFQNLIKTLPSHMEA